MAELQRLVFNSSLFDVKSYHLNNINTSFNLNSNESYLSQKSLDALKSRFWEQLPLDSYSNLTLQESIWRIKDRALNLLNGEAGADVVLNDEVKVTRKFEVKCEDLHPDAESAITRAKSVECKQKLMDISCRHQQQSMFPASLPRFCPLKGA